MSKRKKRKSIEKKKVLSTLNKKSALINLKSFRKKKFQKKVSEKKSRKKKKLRVSTGVLSRYNKIQRILSDYTRGEGIKLGRHFNKVASEISRRVGKTDLRFVGHNIDALYRDSYREVLGDFVVGDRVFANDFPFYNFRKILYEPVYEGVSIRVKFKDSSLDLDFTGSSEEVEFWYNSNLYDHLRLHYGASPVAYFRLIESDYKSYVVYQVESGVVEAEKKEVVSEKKEEGETENLKYVEKQIELEDKKKLTIENTLKLIDQLKLLGFSNEEIKKVILG